MRGVSMYIIPCQREHGFISSAGFGKSGKLGEEGTYHGTSSNQGDISRPGERFVRAIVVLKDAKRKREACVLSIPHSVLGL